MALGIVFRPELLRDSSFSELLFHCRSSRPHSLMRSRSAGPGAQIESAKVRRIGINDKWTLKMTKHAPSSDYGAAGE
ncbi:MAG: hypothetical protein DME87_03470 [Verrucomicrobia bacterium]|nr:MAG: hypothetical protein DME87_03470 [Verrucomicrobiota bacterium]